MVSSPLYLHQPIVSPSNITNTHSLYVACCKPLGHHKMNRSNDKRAKMKLHQILVHRKCGVDCYRKCVHRELCYFISRVLLGQMLQRRMIISCPAVNQILLNVFIKCDLRFEAFINELYVCFEDRSLIEISR